MRNMEDNPYTKDEARVAEYINKITDMGGGDDPIGFLIASHNWLRTKLEMYREIMNERDGGGYD